MCKLGAYSLLFLLQLNGFKYVSESTVRSGPVIINILRNYTMHDSINGAQI